MVIDSYQKQPTAIICLSPYSGGMELDAIKLAKKLSLYSSIKIIARAKYFIDLQKDDYENYNNISLETISFKSSFSFNIILKVRKIVKENNIKNVIFFGASELKSLYFSFFKLDINLIVRHGTTKSSSKKDWFHRLIYSNVGHHVSICKHLLNNVRNIIPFGLDTEEKLIYSSLSFDKPLVSKSDKLILLHIGRIADGKGQLDAIKACQVLDDNNIDFEFNIVGGFDECYKEEFMNSYYKCKYHDKINLVGFTKNIKNYLDSSNVFLFPSYGEGLSNSFLEALSNNIVCISYNNTSFPELKELGLYFQMVENKNIDDLKKKLLFVSNNIDDELLKSTQNYKIVNDFFSLKKELQNYMEILR